MLQDPAIRHPIAISLGAIAGALSRYYLTVWFVQRFGTGFPYGTFLINVTGCFGMGFFTTLALDRVGAISPEVRLLVATGFLGAYTTFSTYGIETLYLLREGAFLSAGLYWAGSAILGVISVQLGVIIARVIGKG
ncbi:fluoride efflux transporter CrcB [Microseira sp. BLCC-F43]|jgi:CrcB protein|uniref:fluoride efflux transporter CrcB n=1 Tax=Microseira sp. BLCC-F43 TaxID=3153602 RepID=UPI0035BAA781